MKSPSSTTLLALAVITNTYSGASAFMPQAVATKSPSALIHSSVAGPATVFFPGRGMNMDGGEDAAGSTGMSSSEDKGTITKRPQATPASKPVTHHTMELIDQLKHDATVIFSIMDTDGSGTISRQEFVHHLTHQSGTHSESFVDQLFDRMMDTKGGGAISENEFRTFYLTVPSLRAMSGMGQSQTNDQKQAVNPYDTIMAEGDQVFASLDKDGNGVVDFSELKAYVNDLGKKFQDEAMMKIFNLLDTDADLSLGREEFMDAYWRYSALRKALG